MVSLSDLSFTAIQSEAELTGVAAVRAEMVGAGGGVAPKRGLVDSGTGAFGPVSINSAEFDISPLFTVGGGGAPYSGLAVLLGS